MTYYSVAAVRRGGPEVLQVVANDLRAPGAGEVRIKVLAASVCRPDVTPRTRDNLYANAKRYEPPFVPGYSVIGTVDAVGEGVTTAVVGDRVAVLTILGGYTEVLYWDAKWLIPVPEGIDPVAAMPLILNYVVAYQVMHRAAKVKPGESAVIVGASGGIGTALLDLGRLAGLKMIGVASASKHEAVAALGATPVGYRSRPFDAAVRALEAGGVDCVFDGVASLDTIRRGFGLLRRGGRMVSFGEPEALPPLLARLVGYNLLPNGKSYNLYGTSKYSLGMRRTFLEDWATLFDLLAEGSIQPVIAATFPILEAGAANALLESGSVVGNIVLAAPELL